LFTEDLLQLWCIAAIVSNCVGGHFS